MTLAQIRYRTRHGDSLCGFFPWSSLLPENRKTIKNALADRGYEWPRDPTLSSAILDALERSQPKRTFKMVRAPGWYEFVFAIPGQVFAPGDDRTKVYIDPESDAHVAVCRWRWIAEGLAGARCQAKPKVQPLAAINRGGVCCPVSAAARPNSFGINWFSDTSDGKTLCLIIAASVAGHVGVEGLPGWADLGPGIEAMARGHRDCVMPLDESADGEHQMPLEKKSRMVAFLIARNRPRKLSPTYERNHNLANREYRIILSKLQRAGFGTNCPRCW